MFGLVLSSIPKHVAVMALYSIPRSEQWIGTSS